MYGNKAKNVYENFNRDKWMFDFSNYSTKYYDGWNKLVLGKMNNESGSVGNREFIRLTPKMYSVLVNNNGKHKKAKDVKRNVLERINHSEYKDEFWNDKWMKHSMNKMENYKKETYKDNKLLLSCFNEKIYIQKNGYGRLVLDYQI